MELSNKMLFKQLIINIIIVLAVFGVMGFFLLMAGEIKKFDVIYFIGAVLSASYVLTVRNPYNYMAFICGVTSSLIMVYALFNTNANIAYTYLFIFLPCQSYSFFVWRKLFYAKLAAKQKEEDDSVMETGGEPRFLTNKELLKMLGLFITVFIIDVLVFYYGFSNNDIILLLLNGFFFTLSISANMLLIRKITDSWIHWVLFSICGIIIALYNGNIDYYMLSIFLVFLGVNSIALYKWIGFTPKENSGWTKIFRK